MIVSCTASFQLRTKINIASCCALIYCVFQNSFCSFHAQTPLLSRRESGHPVLMALVAMGGTLTLRSNWRVYCEEFCLAVKAIWDIAAPSVKDIWSLSYGGEKQHFSSFAAAAPPLEALVQSVAQVPETELLPTPASPLESETATAEGASIAHITSPISTANSGSSIKEAHSPQLLQQQRLAAQLTPRELALNYSQAQTHFEAKYIAAQIPLYEVKVDLGFRDQSQRRRFLQDFEAEKKSNVP